MELLDSQKDMIEDYLKNNVLYRKLTKELICKTIYDIHQFLNGIPGIQILYKPYFGSLDRPPIPTGSNEAFTIIVVLPPDETGKPNTTYLFSVGPVPELPKTSIKKV